MTDPRIEQAALSHLRQDPVLAALIDRFGPPTLQIERDSGRFFGRLVRSIVSQQISVKAAAAILRRVEESLSDEQITPEAVRGIGVEGLRLAGVSGQKSAYLLDLAERVVSGALDLESLPALSDEAVIERLTSVKGIGRWTAQMFLIFTLGRPDVLPVADLGFRTALARQYELGDLPGPEAIEQIAELWRPYRSLGTWYLWRSLDNTPKATEEE